MDAFIVLLGVIIFTTSSSTSGWSVYNESRGLEPYTLDLHNYRLADAEREVPRFLQRRISEYQSGGSELTFIITGHGKHSVDGPRIKPMVEDYLRRNGFEHKWEDHGGRVAVYLQKSGYSRR